MTTTAIRHFRMDTPGTRYGIHLNNAGAALSPYPVIRAVQRHLDLEIQLGGYEAGAHNREALQDFYPAVAQLIGAKPRNIAYTANATDAFARALLSVDVRSGDTILTTRDDYVSNHLAFLQLRKRRGIDLQIAESLPEGGVDPDAVRQLVDRKRPKLITVTHMPTNSGLIQDVISVGQICREMDILYLVDGCQTAGQLNLSIDDIGCDFFSATFRKFLRGPRGTGFLYVSDRVLKGSAHPLFVDLHSARWTADRAYEILPDARRFELWERPYAFMAGAAAAARYAQAVDPFQTEKRCLYLADYLRQRLSERTDLRVMDRGAQKGAIVTFHIPDMAPDTLKRDLEDRGIRSSLAFPEAARYDFAEKGVPWILRWSPHYYNLESEIDQAIDALFDLMDSAW